MQNRQHLEKLPKDADDDALEYVASSNNTEASHHDLGDLPHQDIEPMPSGDSDGSGGFKQLLKQWRVKSDDKPNAHFLSPEHDSVAQESKPLEVWSLKGGVLSPRFILPQPSKSNASAIKETPVVPKRIKEYDKDYFDVVRERDVSSPGDDEPKEMSPKIGRSSTLGDDKPSTHHGNIRGMVDSDVYEDQIIKLEEPSRALIILENRDTYEIMLGDTRRDSNQQLVVRNVELVTSNKEESRMTEYVRCECSNSVFTGNDDLISFFLPQMGMACTCGRQNRGLVNPEVPTAIENVLRPWQVEFLKSFGIHRGEQLVKARHRSADIMAKALRRWRQKKGMAPFKTSSCGMAIDIWAKTCKAYVRSIRKQMNSGNQVLVRQPDVVRELSHFLSDLPNAPRRRECSMVDIVPESQEEM
jgi:hypothetical protein